MRRPTGTQTERVCTFYGLRTSVRGRRRLPPFCRSGGGETPISAGRRQTDRPYSLAHESTRALRARANPAPTLRAPTRWLGCAGSAARTRAVLSVVYVLYVLYVLFVVFVVFVLYVVPGGKLRGFAPRRGRAVAQGHWVGWKG